MPAPDTLLPAPESLLADETVQYAGVGISIDAIAARYAQSEWGLFHARQEPRYTKRYGYDADQMLADLGDDVYPVLHMPHTEGLLDYLIKYQHTAGFDVERFTPEEALHARVAAVLHDVGENTHPFLEETLGAVVGDEWVETKTTQHEVNEAAIRQFVFRQIYGDLPIALLDAAEGIIAGAEPDSLPARAFQMTEYVGYYETGVRAGRLAMSIMLNAPEDMGSHRFEQLTRLGRRVTTNWHDTLADAVEQFPSIGLVLRDAEPAFEAIHTVLPDYFPE